MQPCLIQVPYMAGDGRHGATKGPQRFVEAGIGVLKAKGVDVTAEHVECGELPGDSASASLMVGNELAAVVRRTTAAGQFPLVLAGSCDASKGVLSGLDHERYGVVWIDAHGDFNTPETTTTGFLPGMSLAVITGHCYQDDWAEIGNSVPIAEAATLMLGVRDLDPEERELLERSTIQVVKWDGGKPERSVETCVRALAERVHEIYLHIDMDAFDPLVAPGVDYPVTGGLSLRDMEEVIGEVASRFQIRAATLAAYNPDQDRDDKTLNAGLRIIELLAESAATTHHSRAS